MSSLSKSKDASWHAIVTNLLGPPQKLDFDEEAKRRAQRKGLVSSKIVPSDDQCRYLWKFHSTSCCHQNSNENDNARQPVLVLNQSERVKHSETENNNGNCASETVENDKIANAKPLIRAKEALQASLLAGNHKNVAPVAKIQTSRQSIATSQTSNTTIPMKSIKSNRVSLSPERRRPRRQNPPSSPGWISRSRFYNDSKPSARKETSEADFPDEDCNNNSTRGTFAIKRKRLSPHESNTCSDNPRRRSKCACIVDTNKQPQSPNLKQEVGTGDSSFDLSSPEEKLSAERPKKKLFRPSVRRANNRLKQRSILDAFGKR